MSSEGQGADHRAAAPSSAADALSGLRVLDFSIMMAGPYCARLMADLGADVIKIESPEGDDMRLRAPLRNGHGPYFGQLNVGKRSLTMDLKHSESIALLRDMAASADVLVENFRPGVMRRLGLDHAALSAINPRLVYCSISGYGQTGPGAGRAAYAPLIHAASGLERTLMRYAGERDRPAPGAIFFADVLGAIYAFSAVQAALVQRAATGRGQHVDVALMDCMMNLLVYELQSAQFPSDSPRPTYGPVRAGDGDIMVMPITPKNFTALCEVIGRPKLVHDERFATLPARNRHWPVMMGLVEAWSCTRTVQACIEALNAAGVPCTAYADPEDALNDPQLQARGSFMRIEDAAGSFVASNPPFKMSGSQSQLRGRVPQVGEHTDEVLAEFGLHPQRIAALRAAGALGATTREAS